MIYQEIPVQVEGSLHGAKLTVYMQPECASWTKLAQTWLETFC